MDGSLGMSDDFHAYVTRPDGIVVHQGLVGSMEKFSDDAIGAGRGMFLTALHALHLNSDGVAQHADLLAAGVSHVDAAAQIDPKNIKGAYHMGPGLVTTAGVNALAADWTNTTATLKLANYGDLGTGTTAAAIGQTALVTPTGNARVTGTQSNPVAGTYQSASSFTFAAAFAITEFGLFLAASAGTMWDRKVFGAVNVSSGDGLATSYAIVCASGG